MRISYIIIRTKALIAIHITKCCQLNAIPSMERNFQELQIMTKIPDNLLSSIALCLLLNGQAIALLDRKMMSSKFKGFSCLKETAKLRFTPTNKTNKLMFYWHSPINRALINIGGSCTAWVARLNRRVLLINSAQEWYKMNSSTTVNLHMRVLR